MRKLWILFLLPLLPLKAQVFHPLGPIFHQGQEPVNGPLRQNTPLYFNYSLLNGDDYSFGWPLNEYYTNADTAINYIALAYDQLAGFYDYANYTTTTVTHTELGFSSPYPGNLNIRIDSIVAYVLHENNSGINDTLIFELHTLNTDNSIASTVLWADSIITNQGMSPGNNWISLTSLVTKRIPVGLTPAPGQKTGIVLRYLNHNKLDTFAIPGGFVRALNNPQQAQQSFYKNSFMRLPPFTPSIIKTSDYQYGSGNYFPGQNWVISILAEIMNTSMGQNDLFHRKIPIAPNPSCNGLFTLYDAGNLSEADLHVYDLTGAVVPFTFSNHGNIALIQISRKGIFQLVLNLPEGNMVKKLLVTD